MSIFRSLSRLLLFLGTVAAIAVVAWLADQSTYAQTTAYQREGTGSGLVRNVNAPWRNLNPDNLENQALQVYLNLNRQSIDTPVNPGGETFLSMSPWVRRDYVFPSACRTWALFAMLPSFVSTCVSTIWT